MTKPWWPTEPSSVATTYSTSSGSSDDGIDVARARAAEQQRDLPAVADRLVGERPHAGDPEAARDEQHVLRPRVHLERPPERPEHVDAVARAGGA